MDPQDDNADAGFEHESPDSSHASHDAEGTAEHDATTAGNLRPAKKRRACEACRRLKVQCNFESNKSDTCRRCRKAGRECVVMERRRRQVIANSVSELEKKLEALQTQLNSVKGAKGESAGQNDGGASESSPGNDGDSQAGESSHMASGDVIDRGILSLGTAINAFDHFVADMVPHYPIVVFPIDTNAHTIRHEKPVLFLACLAAAAVSLPMEAQPRLHEEIMRTLSHKILMVGEKSLELIQATQVTLIWYLPPHRFEDMKHYQYCQSAAVMAIDIGLTKRHGRAKAAVGKQNKVPDQPEKAQNTYPDPSTVESRRAWLGCYVLSSQTAQSFRRENIIRWSPYMEECITVLEESPDAMATDQLVCHWARIQRLIDDVSVEFSIGDSTASETLDLMKIRFSVQGFETQLKSLIRHPLRVQKPTILILAELTARLYMNEVALHAGHPTDDMEPPFHEEALKNIRPTQAAKLSAGHISALSSCLTTIHAIFDTFLSFHISTLRDIPTINFVRLMYSCIVLLKIAYDCVFPESNIGKMLTLEDFKIEYYLPLLSQRLGEAGEGGAAPTAFKFSKYLAMLRAMFNRVIGVGPALPQSYPAPVPINTDPRGSIDSDNSGGVWQQSSPIGGLDDSRRPSDNPSVMYTSNPPPMMQHPAEMPLPGGEPLYSFPDHLPDHLMPDHFHPVNYGFDIPGADPSGGNLFSQTLSNPLFQVQPESYMWPPMPGRVSTPRQQ